MPSTPTSRKLYHVISYLFKRMAELARIGDMKALKDVIDAEILVCHLRDEELDN